MPSFPDTPLEITEQIIGALQDDLTALKLCSQTCHSLLPLCRQFIFRSITLRPFSVGYGLPRLITLFGGLLESNPSISDYVRNLTYEIHAQDLEDDNVPQILAKFRRVQSFRLIGGDADWETLCRPLRESLSNIVHLPSITDLEISHFAVFPITEFLPCLNLTDLTVIHIRNDASGYEQNYYTPNAVPKLQSFTFEVKDGGYVGRLIAAKRSKGLPMFCFQDLRTLIVCVRSGSSDSLAAHALLEVAEKLEYLEYVILGNFPDGYKGLAASMNPSSLSTLRELRFEFEIHDDIQDPLCGICDELGAFSGVNRIEEINIYIQVEPDCRCRTDDQWGTLDAVLATGFPKLSRVLLHIIIFCYPSYTKLEAMVLQAKLEMLPEEQFPWLSTGLAEGFDFSTEVQCMAG